MSSLLFVDDDDDVPSLAKAGSTVTICVVTGNAVEEDLRLVQQAGWAHLLFFPHYALSRFIALIEWNLSTHSSHNQDRKYLNYLKL